MDKIIIYLQNRISCEVDKKEFEYMKEKNIIYLNYNTYYLNKLSEFHYLFSYKTSIEKKQYYINELSNQSFICCICGKKHSYNIGPLINENNEVDFSIVKCFCKECRNSKLKSRNIIKPVYKTSICWSKELEIIKNNIKKFNIHYKSKKHYKNLSIKIFMFERYITLVLPTRDLSKYINLNKELDFSNLQTKKLFKISLFENFNKICPICGKEIEFKDFTLDHIIAKRLGGTDNENNLIGMCEECNNEKGHKTILEFLCEKELHYLPDLFIYLAKVQQTEIKNKLVLLKKTKDDLENKNKSINFIK